MVQRRHRTHGAQPAPRPGQTHCLRRLTRLRAIRADQRAGPARAPERRRKEITILDMFGKAACVRGDAADWIDYLHMDKLNGQRQIVNV